VRTCPHRVFFVIIIISRIPVRYYRARARVCVWNVFMAVLLFFGRIFLHDRPTGVAATTTARAAVTFCIVSRRKSLQMFTHIRNDCRDDVSKNHSALCHVMTLIECSSYRAGWIRREGDTTITDTHGRTGYKAGQLVRVARFCFVGLYAYRPVFSYWRTSHFFRVCSYDF